MFEKHDDIDSERLETEECELIDAAPAVQDAPLLFRQYRNVLPEEVRIADLGADSGVTTRFTVELRSWVLVREAARSELSGKLDKDDEAEPLRCKIAEADQAMSLWCDRLAICLTTGDYLIARHTSFELMKLLYRVLIEDPDMVFRNVECWEGAASCLREVCKRRATPHAPPEDGQLVSWKLLEEFIEKVFHRCSREREHVVAKIVQDKVRSHMGKIVAAAAELFDGASLVELWDRYAPLFRPDGSSSIQGLAYFVSLAPPFQLLATDRQQQMTRFVLEFLFQKTHTWHQTSLNWTYFSWAYLSKLVPYARGTYHLCDYVDMDTFAEPFFSSILHCLRLPVGENDMRRALRVGGKPNFEMFMRDVSSSTLQRAQGVVVHFFPANVKSPLWNQLRRFLRATELFLRPTAAVTAGALQLSTLLYTMVVEMTKRVDRQRKLAKSGITSRHFLGQAEVDEFAQLLLPALFSALYSKKKSIAAEAHFAVQCCCRMAPLVCVHEVFRYSSIGLNGGASSEAHQAIIALELLGNAVPELLLGWRDRTDGEPHVAHAVVEYMCNISDKILPMIDPNDLPKAMLATRLLIQGAMYFDLHGVCLPPLSDKISDRQRADTEQAFILSFVEKLISMSEHSDANLRQIMSAFFVSTISVFAAVGDTAISAVSDKVARKAGELGMPAAMPALAALLHVAAVRDPQAMWRKSFPAIRRNLMDPLTSAAETRWHAHMLLGLLQCRDAAVVFEHVRDIKSIINALLSRITNKERVWLASCIYEALVCALTHRNPYQSRSESYRTSGCPDMRRPDSSGVCWREVPPAHIQFCVDLCNDVLRSAFADLDSLEEAVARRERLAQQVLSASDRDDDEPLSVQSLRRHTLRWVLLTVEINVALFASDRSTDATRELESLIDVSLPASHIVTPRNVVQSRSQVVIQLPQEGRELLWHADEIIARLLAVLPHLVGSDNYVASRSPPSSQSIENPAGFLQAEGNADAKSLVYCIRTMSLLENISSPSKSLNEPWHLLLENWRSQFQLANGTRLMPAFFWLVSAEVQHDERCSRTQIHTLQRNRQAVAAACFHLATHHRYKDVQNAARSLFCKLYMVEGPCEQFSSYLNAAVEDLKCVSSVAQKLVASGGLARTSAADSELHGTLDDDDALDVVAAGSNPVEAAPEAVTTCEMGSKRFDHEISGLLQLLCQTLVLTSFVIPCMKTCINIIELTLEFPDVLLPSEEAWRRALVRNIIAVRQFSRLTRGSFFGLAQVLTDKAHRLASSLPSRAYRWLELLLALWHPADDSLGPRRGPLSAASCQQLMRLAVSDHLQVRQFAMHALAYGLGAVKRVRKRVVRELAQPSDDVLPVDRNLQTVRRQALADLAHRAPLGMRNVGQCFAPPAFMYKETDELLHWWCDAGLNHDFVKAFQALSGVDGSAVVSPSSWVWDLAHHFESDSKGYRTHRMTMWKLVGYVCGPEKAVRSLRAVCFGLLEEWQAACTGSANATQVAIDKAKESHKGLLAVVCEMCGACVRFTKRSPPQTRQEALKFLFDVVVQMSLPSVSHEALPMALRMVMELRDVTTADEAQQFFTDLLGAIERSLAASSASGTSSQDAIRLLTVFLQLLNTFSYDIIGAAVPMLCHRIVLLRALFLGSPLSQVRTHAASCIRQLLQCALQEVDGRRCVRNELECLAVELLDAALSEDEASRRSTNSADQISAEESTSSVAGDLDVSPQTLNACKVNVVLWAYPAAPLLATMFPRVIKFYAAVLEIRLAESDDLVSCALGGLLSAAFTRIDKPSALAACETCADVLLEVFEFGRGRQAKIAICRTLRVLLYVNLHRIGKYATMLRMSEAAIQCMSHADKRVRNEGKTLLSVIVKVASAEQTGAMIREVMQRLRAIEGGDAVGTPVVAASTPQLLITDTLHLPLPLDSPTDAGSPAVSATFIGMRTNSTGRRLGLCTALCGAVLADPDAVPSYVPRVLERLAPLARDRNPDVSSVVRQTLVEWWSTHRDKWEFSHKQHFTQQQLVLLMELFTSPTYYI